MEKNETFVYYITVTKKLSFWCKSQKSGKFQKSETTVVPVIADFQGSSVNRKYDCIWF